MNRVGELFPKLLEVCTADSMGKNEHARAEYLPLLEQAESFGHSIRREYAFLIAHSMLHLCGYDHMEPDEASVMEEKQNHVLDRLGITRDISD